MDLEKMAGFLFLSIFSSLERGLIFLFGSPPQGCPGYSARCDNRFMAIERKRRKPNPEPSDADVRAILVQAMADVGADPALVYAFRKTGVYICDENEKQLPKESLKAFDGAVDEYFTAVEGPVQ
jgi:hypothetical protein